MTGPAGTAARDASLYAEVTWFYARQMHWLDRGEADRWADTFTEDAVFHLPTRPEPMRGRAGLLAGARAAAAAIAEAGERRRHVAGMYDIDRGPRGTLRTRYSIVVYATTTGGPSRVHQVCVCEDTLVRPDGELRVSTRHITLDDVA